MKAIGTVLLVLVAIIGMAGPVLGASAGSNANAYTDWLYTAQSTDAWAYNADQYATAGSSGDAIIIGDTGSGSSASASDDDYAAAQTLGGSEGLFVDTESHAYAENYDTGGTTDAGAGSTASGDDVLVNSGAGGQNWNVPFSSNAWASGSAFGIWGNVESGAGAEADAP